MCNNARVRLCTSSGLGVEATDANTIPSSTLPTAQCTVIASELRLLLAVFCKGTVTNNGEKGWRFYTNQTTMKSSGQTMGKEKAPKTPLPPPQVNGADPADPTNQFELGSGADHMVIRIPDVGLAGAPRNSASSSLFCIDGLEQYLMSFGQVPAVAHTSPGLLSNSSQRKPTYPTRTVMKACLDEPPRRFADQLSAGVS